VRPKRLTRCALALLAAITAFSILPAAAPARQSVRLDAALIPERLGHDTTIAFGFRITAPAGHVPPPLTSMKVSYPFALAVQLSELGTAGCSEVTLEIFGPIGCPANSIMGHGTIVAEIQVGPSIIHETAQTTILRTTDRGGHVTLLIYANGKTPVYAQIVFPGVLLSAPAPYGGLLKMKIPLVPSLPGAADVAVVEMHATLGPAGLTYHEYIHGETINYRPRGIPLPTNCPVGGFKFAATFTFQNHSHSHATTTVPCPGQHSY
jgi:hypothetical protein